MKKLIILLIFIIFCTGCNKNNSSNEIKPTSIYNPTPDDAAEFLKESGKIGKVDTDKNDIPFECKEIEYQVYISINKIRKENNLNELEWDAEMYTHILTRTDELSKKFSHTRPNGKSCFTIYDKLHGENIANGYQTADDVIKGWMDSKGHKENILGKSFKRTSIGYIKKDSGTYWCQGFGY